MRVGRGEVDVRQAEENKAQAKGSRAEWGAPGCCSGSSGTPHHSTASPGQGGWEPAAATSYSVTSSSSNLGSKSTGFSLAGDLQEERIGAVVKTVGRLPFCSSPAPAADFFESSPKAKSSHAATNRKFLFSDELNPCLGDGELTGVQTLPPSAKISPARPLNIKVDLFSGCYERTGPRTSKRSL